ncbi:MAG: polysaccharide export protein [Lachnospiraceae bacterium]|nr:polysaccharide export protein [Lachnospiraceae bacterium]
MDRYNSQERRADDEITIDLLELARVVWKNIWLVIIAIVVGAVLSFVITKIFITPKYQATSTIYILSKSTSITSLADLQIGSQLAGDFEIIATTRELLEKVSADNNLNMTYEELKKEIKVTNPSNTHMLRVAVTDPDPQKAALISNALADELRDEIAEIMNTDRPSTVEQAVVPTKKYSPSTTKNVAIGAIVLAILAIFIIAIRYLADDTIKDDEDVKKYLELDTLAQFPLLKGQTTKTAKKKRK